jgi:hypothetical protein
LPGMFPTTDTAAGDVASCCQSRRPHARKFHAAWHRRTSPTANAVDAEHLRAAAPPLRSGDDDIVISGRRPRHPRDTRVTDAAIGVSLAPWPVVASRPARSAMASLWGWAIALLCVAALFLFLFACLFLSVLAFHAPPDAAGEDTGEDVRERVTRAGSAGRTPIVRLRRSSLGIAPLAAIGRHRTVRRGGMGSEGGRN